ncbi:MAG: ATP-binding protein [Actinobacteria bacterium]|nr:ATP-binding protein [Actinomycetota bacterium]
MIVVEGPDGAGKTTLIRDLSALLNIPVAPRVVSQETKAMVDLRQWTEDNVSRGVPTSRDLLFTASTNGLQQRGK